MVLQSSPDPLPDRPRPYDNGHRPFRARRLDNIKRTPVFPSLGYIRGGELHHHCILPTGKRCPSAARPISRSMRVGPEGKGDSTLTALLRPSVEHVNGKILLVALTSRRQTTFPPHDVNNDPVGPITDLPDHPPLLRSAQSVLLGQRIVRQINHRKPRQPRRLDRGGRGEVGTIAFAFPRCTRNARKQQSSPDDGMLDRTPHWQAPTALDVRSACPLAETMGWVSPASSLVQAEEPTAEAIGAETATEANARATLSPTSTADLRGFFIILLSWLASSLHPVRQPRGPRCCR